MTRSALADDRNPVAAHCYGKAAFDSPQLAWAVVLRSVRTRGLRHPYRCQTCGRWHIGGAA